MRSYQEFLEDKAIVSPASGFDPGDEISDALFPFQCDIVRWACMGGRRAIFAAFGLGKSVMQLELMRLINKFRGGRQLIVCPLGVRQEFMRDAELLGMEPTFVRRSAEVSADGCYITNYESVRDGKLDVSLFNATTLDEASVLRSYGSKTYQTFLELFAQVPYRFVATATPSPNRHKELIHYAGYLGIMDTGQALTRFFKRDSTKANNLKLYPHKEREFWLWLASWAVFVQRPSDLGYSDEGYDLPEIEVVWHRIETSKDERAWDRNGQGRLMADTSMGLSEAARVKRDTMDARVAKAKELVDAAPDDHFVLWHDLEAERHAIKRAIPEAVEVYGSQDIEERERRIVAFSDGDVRLLATKPILSGSGCNFQRHCHREIFCGVGFKFNDFIQAIHRVQRFQQTERVRIDIIHADAEENVVKVLKEKWRSHEELTGKMERLIKEYGLADAAIAEAMRRSIGVERMEATGRGWTAVNADTVEETRTMPDESVDLIVTSIPFCYDEATEVLTSDGWKSFQDLSHEELIATYNEGTKSIEYQKPTAYVNEPYDGEMIEFTGRAFNLSVTPNHRMYAARRSSGELKYGIYTADEIAREYEDATRKVDGAERIARAFKLQVVPENATAGKKPERIDIPKLPSDVRRGHGVELYWIEAEDFMRLAGWYLSEGHADSFDGRSGGRINIGQSKTVNPDNYQEIVDLFLRIGLPPTESSNQIVVWCRNLAYFLQTEFGHGANHKHIPRWVMELDGSLLEILRDTMMKGDGSKDGTSYASNSKQLRNDFQELCIKTGWRAILPGGKWVYTGEKQIHPEIRHIPQRYHYEGRIGCVTVPNGLIIVRRHGFPCISGNSNHYEYTPSYNDFGHTEDDDHFFRQMDYLTPELLRVLKPGRICCVHVKDRINFGNVTGKGIPTVQPFHAECIDHYIGHGFDYMGMITVVTDVVRENNQTYRLGWSENAKDGSKMGVGSPEYVLLLHKPQTDRTKGYADVPITHPKDEYSRARWQTDAHAFWRSSGDRLLTPEEVESLSVGDLSKMFRKRSSESVYDYESHVKVAEEIDEIGRLPSTFMALAPQSWCDDVWSDINRMLTLNTSQSQKGREQHVCPLQLDLIKRLIERYSNPGELVFDPFGGLMSVPYVALQTGRTGRGHELNTRYFLDGVKYLEAEEHRQDMPTLFDLCEIA